MSSLNTPFTPQRIVDENILLSIPVYQRLFVWGEEQINKLLEDLYDASLMTSPRNYYIGAITIWQRNDKSCKEDIWEIVDGQQRLTFLALFFAMCKSIFKESTEKWLCFNHPCLDSNELRIRYVGRSDDKRGFVNLENGGTDKVNDHFGVFRGCFLSFLAQKNINVDSPSGELTSFIDYVFSKSSFLVVKLPDDYTTYDLNLYFEKLNSTGRQISPADEIRGMLQMDDAQLEIWNDCMDFSVKYCCPKGIVTKDSASFKEVKTLGDLLKSSKMPTGDADASEASNRLQFERSILSPEMFLSHILYLYQNAHTGCLSENGISDETSNKKEGMINESTNVNNDIDETRIVNDDKVVSAFREVLKSNNVFDYNCFLNIMKGYRQWIDEHIICLDANGNDPYKFRDGVVFSEDDERNMLALQSFLYVSSNDKQIWLLEAYQKNDSFSIEDLEDADNRRHPLPQDGNGLPVEDRFSYQAHNRYWFFKLDYLLWKTRKSWWNSVGKYKQAIDNFVFRQNRSIEHLHPQNPPVELWGEEDVKQLRDFFGNLALITPASNSSISNLSVQEKFARIQGRFDRGYGLESLKLFRMGMIADFQEAGWTPKRVREHKQEMFTLLGYTIPTVSP